MYDVEIISDTLTGQPKLPLDVLDHAVGEDHRTIHQLHLGSVSVVSVEVHAGLGRVRYGADMTVSSEPESGTTRARDPFT